MARWKRKYWDSPPWYARVPYIRAACLYFEIAILVIEALFTERLSEVETWNAAKLLKVKYVAFYSIRHKPGEKSWD